MSITPKQNVIPFPGPSARSNKYPVLAEPLFLGLFSVSDRLKIIDRFENRKESVSRLANEYKCGDLWIEEVIRIARKPPGLAKQNDRRQIRKVAA